MIESGQIYRTTGGGLRVKIVPSTDIGICALYVLGDASIFSDLEGVVTDVRDHPVVPNGVLLDYGESAYFASSELEAVA